MLTEEQREAKRERDRRYYASAKGAANRERKYSSLPTTTACASIEPGSAELDRRLSALAYFAQLENPHDWELACKQAMAHHPGSLAWLADHEPNYGSKAKKAGATPSEPLWATEMATEIKDMLNEIRDEIRDDIAKFRAERG